MENQEFNKSRPFDSSVGDDDISHPKRWLFIYTLNTILTFSVGVGGLIISPVSFFSREKVAAIWIQSWTPLALLVPLVSAGSSKHGGYSTQG